MTMRSYEKVIEDTSVLELVKELDIRIVDSPETSWITPLSQTFSKQTLQMQNMTQSTGFFYDSPPQSIESTFQIDSPSGSTVSLNTAQLESNSEPLESIENFDTYSNLASENSQSSMISTISNIDIPYGLSFTSTINNSFPYQPLSPPQEEMNSLTLNTFKNHFDGNGIQFLTDNDYKVLFDILADNADR